MTTRTITRKELLETGLFHTDYSVLCDEYLINCPYRLDLILLGAINVVFEAHKDGNRPDQWYVIKDLRAITEAEFDQIPALYWEFQTKKAEFGIWKKVDFETLLEVVRPEVRGRLLFHLNLFV